MNAGEILAEYGLAGLAILVLGAVVLYLERDRQRLSRKLDKEHLQRLSDQKENAELHRTLFERLLPLIQWLKDKAQSKRPPPS